MAAKKKSDNDLYNNSSEDFIPVACHYDENTLLTKNGELLQTIQIKGINAEHISQNLFNLRQVVRQSISNAIKNNKYSLWVHTVRKKVDLDDPAEYHGFLSANTHDIWRRKNFWHDKFINKLYITVVHESSSLKIKNLNSLINSLSAKTIAEFEAKFHIKALEELTATVNNILQGLKEYGASRLTIRMEGEKCYSDPMFLFRNIMQLKEQDCLVPTADIAAALASHKYAVGSDKMEVIGAEGKKFAAIMSIKEYQEVSAEALDKFLQIPVEMIATEVFYFVDKKIVIKSYADQNYILKVSKDNKLRALKGLDKIFDQQDNDVRFCYQQIAFMIIGDNLQALDKQVEQASEALAKTGIVHVREDINLEKTFWAQLPGNFSFLTRMKPTLLTNTAALASLHNFPTGNQYSPWGRAITILRTEKGTPYFMNFHDSHGISSTCIFGEKKTGKTTLLNFLLSESDKYFPSVIYITDDLDSGLYIKARGGSWFQRKQNIINPLLCDDTPKNRAYMFDFFKIIARHYFDPLIESDLAILKTISDSVFAIPLAQRKLSLILSAIEQSGISERITDYLEGGIYYGIFEQEALMTIDQGELIAFNLQAFDDKLYIKNNYPKEKKLVEQFEYNLNSLRAVRAGIVFAMHNALMGNEDNRKIFAIDNFSSIIDLQHYQHLIDHFSDSMTHNNGVMLFSMDTDNLIDVAQVDTLSWIDRIGTSFILPADIYSTKLEKILRLSTHEFRKIANMTTSSHMFFIRQDQQTIATELSLGGLNGLIRVLSSGSAERLIYKEVTKTHGSIKPEDWVEVLYERLEHFSS